MSSGEDQLVWRPRRSLSVIATIVFGALIVIGFIPVLKRPDMWWWALGMVAIAGSLVAAVWLSYFKVAVLVDNQARRITVCDLLSTREFSFDDVLDVSWSNHRVLVKVLGVKRRVVLQDYMSGPSNLRVGLNALATFNTSPELRRVAPFATRSFPTGGVADALVHATQAAVRAAQVQPAERAQEP